MDKVSLTFSKNSPAVLLYKNKTYTIEYDSFEEARFKVLKILGIKFKRRGLDDYLGFDVLEMILKHNNMCLEENNEQH